MKHVKHVKHLLVLLSVLLLTGPALPSTVTYTDPDGVATNTEPLPLDGHFAFRIQVPDLTPSALPTESVQVTDDTGQMAPGCYPIQNGQTIAVTSELVIAAAPVVTVTGQAFSTDTCTGATSVASNPITVTFVPEVPSLLAPLSP